MTLIGIKISLWRLKKTVSKKHVETTSEYRLINSDMILVLTICIIKINKIRRTNTIQSEEIKSFINIHKY